ncbi:ionotropic receptor 25a-like [Gigantopelta aegis]|uniref:ionotropic receptor 25a-like n=1 Tax=Gigantopelta aegis TaxID=1735272 RepID=UPI001B88CB63|nr:ionotropic receptor 25a-like [Gigantopelta aegis]XP_041363769.1 ionotropic receptor 25a-like [Gigantopelta aegis]
MVLGRYYWIVLTTDSKVPRCHGCAKYSAIYIRDNNATTQDSRYRPLLQRLVDFTNAAISELTSQKDTKVLCDCQKNCESCFRAIRDVVKKLSGSQSGIYVQGYTSQQYPLSFDIVRYDYDGSLMKVGHWNGETIDKNSSLYPDNSTAIVLRVVSLVEPPFVFRNTTGGQLSYYGYSIDAIREIAKSIGFTFTVKECDEKFYGYAGSDGQWNGCIGNILRGEADIIVAALTVTAEREKVVDFTLPYYDFAGIQILMKKPNRDISLFYFADVFTPIAWLCLGVVVVVTSILLLLFDRFTPMSEDADDYERGQSFDLKESIWYVVGSLTMSGGGDPPRSIPARILVAGFWFFSIVIMSTFTANLAAFLTVSRMGASISSLNELASQSDVRFSVVKETSIMNYFKRMAAIEDNFYTIWKDMSLGVYGDAKSLAVWDYPLGDKYVNIWKSINATGFMNSTEDAMVRLAQGNFAYFTDSPVVKYLTSRDCDLTAVGDVFSIRPYAFALKNKSTWTKKISAAILKLQKERILEELKMKWWTKGAVKCSDSVSDRGLDLKSLAGSFIVVAVGISSGLLMLVLEFIWNTFRRGKPCSTLQVSVEKEGTTASLKTESFREQSTNDRTDYVINNKDQSKTQYTVYGDEVDTLY